MSKKKIEVVKSTTEPNKNDIWFNGKEFKYFGKKGWENVIKTSDIPVGDGTDSTSGTSARELYVDYEEQGLTDEQKAYNIETINLIDSGKVPNMFFRINDSVNIPLKFDYLSYVNKNCVFSTINTMYNTEPGILGTMSIFTLLPTGEVTINEEYILGLNPYEDFSFSLLKVVDSDQLETLTINDLQGVQTILVRGTFYVMLYLSKPSWNKDVYRSTLIKDGDRWCIKELEVGESGSVYRTIYFDINEVDDTSN